MNPLNRFDELNIQRAMADIMAVGYLDAARTKIGIAMTTGKGDPWLCFSTDLEGARDVIRSIQQHIDEAVYDGGRE